MLRILTTAALWACAAAASFAPEENVAIAVERSPNTIELAVTDDTLDSQGLLVAASIDLKIDTVDGIARINDQYVLPVGLTLVNIKADVKEYVMSMGSTTKRRCHKTVSGVDMGVAARVHKDESQPHVMHVTLQVTQYDGHTRNVDHTTLISLTLNDHDEEIERAVNPKSKPLTVQEKIEAAKHKLSSFLEHAKAHAPDDEHAFVCWIKEEWKDTRGKVTLIAIGSLLLIAVSLFVYAFFRCLFVRPVGAATKGPNYRKNLAMGPVRVLIPAEKYKYTPLKSHA